MSTNAYLDGIQWKKQNEDLWNTKVVPVILDDAAHKRPILLQQVFEDIRKHDHVNAEGQPVHVNNNHIAIFARILWTEHPEVRPYLHLRRSVWDDLFGIRIGVDGKPRPTEGASA